MLPNCTKDACDGIHKSATKKQFYDAQLYHIVIMMLLFVT